MAKATFHQPEFFNWQFFQGYVESQASWCGGCWTPGMLEKLF